MKNEEVRMVVVKRMKKTMAASWQYSENGMGKAKADVRTDSQLMGLARAQVAATDCGWGAGESKK